MSAGELNIEIEQGAKFLKTLRWKDALDAPISLAGFEARMHVRESKDADTILLELTTGNGKIELEPGGDTGLIRLYVGATETAALDWVAGVYDLEIVETADPENVTRLVEGKVKVSLEVTK